MATITPDNDNAKLNRDIKWVKRRVKELYGSSWSGKTDAEKIEALQDVVAPMARIILQMQTNEYEDED